MSVENYNEAVRNIKFAILASQYQTAKMANANLLSLYFGIGKYVSANSREGFWGTGAIKAISTQLQAELPGLKGFSASSIKNMRQFYEQWISLDKSPAVAGDLKKVKSATTAADLKKVKSAATAAELATIEISSLLSSREIDMQDFDIEKFLSLSFSHHMEILIKTKSVDERIYYINNAVRCLWDKYTLRDYLKADVFHHQGNMPNNFERTIKNSADCIKAISMFKDEYLVDYMNVEELDITKFNDVDEAVIEKSIVNNIAKFIMQMGATFTFAGNQYRLEYDGEEFFVDLLFYNRELRCFVAIELKKGKFKPSYLGQLGFYLTLLDKNVKLADENPSIGIVLCKEMKESVVELAVRDYNAPMGVATYRRQKDVPKDLQKSLPDIDKMREILSAED